jgi:predicted DNA repair protein MutK
VSRLRDFHINGDGAADAQHAEKLAALADDSVDLAALEADKIKGAIRTDFVLSAEIVVIALGTVAGASFTTQVAVLSGIGVLMTVGVYGIVAGIVKLDDLGLYLLKKSGAPAQAVGKALVLAAPRLMKALTVIGTAAMFMVGGSILSHGLPPVHHFIENAAELAAAVGTVGGVLKALSSLSLEMLVGVVGGSLALLATQAFATLRGAVRRKSERPADPRPDPEQHP